ncbi:hypothetical protein [Halapricum salinum]|uniref:RCK C-terminal domain-containing protein n=1 Tax=Halapricum salinum TaxID=1457250 RepID=A0A4D6H8Z2_9EURY|nr:hypothetical protein [Halapricum salinum]QCC50329.1 hypothetical protein DV733_03345 [Halapricum salinum]
MIALQTIEVTGEVLRTVARAGGLAIGAGLVAGICAFVYRWYADQRAPLGLVVLVGLSVIAIDLNTRVALGTVINEEAVVDVGTVLYHIGVIAAGAFASAAGQRAGDRLAADVFATTGVPTISGEVGRVVKAVGRVLTVEMPAEIDDIVGYDPVSEETKTKIAGESFIFPRRLTVAELRERLTARLKADYGVGHVDVELDDEGTVTYLALGRRAAGIGPTLPPESAAMAIRADPAYAAGAGDIVQIWRGDGSERICNAEVRGTAGEIVTVAIDAAETPKLDSSERYRLVTLSVDSRPDREFASLLRAATETLGVVEIDAGSALDGAPVGSLDVTVIAVSSVVADERVETIPDRERVLDAEESIYVLATPEALRKVEAAATTPA